MKHIAIFAVVCLIGCVYSGTTAVRVFGAMNAHITIRSLPCDLTPASSVAAARIKATCVRATTAARSVAANLNGSYHVHVPSNSCSEVAGNSFVWDCTFSATFGGTDEACNGTVRVRGRSKDPAKLSRHLRGMICTA